MTGQVRFWTSVFNGIESVVGWTNLGYLGAAALAALLSRSYASFFFATSQSLTPKDCQDRPCRKRQPLQGASAARFALSSA